jgi:chitinase
VVAAGWRGAAAVTSGPATVTVPVKGPPDDNPPAGRKPWVTGYYAAWYWNWLYPPEKVDMTALTHFVFGRVAPGGGGLGGEPGGLEQGAWSAQESGGAPDGSGRSIEDYLVDRAHDAGRKALLMLGGDGFDGRGFMLSSQDAVRPTFVDNIVDYLVEHDYDGVDLDWENCLDGHTGCGEPEGEEPVPPAEAQRRLLALIADVRAEMATRQRYAASPGLITFPGYTIKINENDGEPEPWQTEVALRVDQYNLMSYGIGTTFNGGGWLSWFSGALFGAGGLNPVDISSSVAAYEESGVPRDRIGIGIGFYGIYYGPTITEPRKSTDGNNIYEIYDPALAYSVLDQLGYLSHGTRKWDAEAQSTYRVYGNGGFVADREYGPDGEELPLRAPAGLLSYEDEQSIAAKGKWVRETGVGGTILWTMNYGWLPRTGTNPLMDAVKESFLE